MDANGTPVTVKYQAVVKEVVPTSTNATSTGPQGLPQTGAPTFQGGDPLVPIDETVEPTSKMEAKRRLFQVKETYTIAPDGTVTSRQTNSLSETQIQSQSNVWIRTVLQSLQPTVQSYESDPNWFR